MKACPSLAFTLGCFTELTGAIASIGESVKSQFFGCSVAPPPISLTPASCPRAPQTPPAPALLSRSTARDCSPAPRVVPAAALARFLMQSAFSTKPNGALYDLRCRKPGRADLHRDQHHLCHCNKSGNQRALVALLAIFAVLWWGARAPWGK
jgi:hypothetical protein